MNKKEGNKIFNFGKHLKRSYFYIAIPLLFIIMFFIIPIVDKLIIILAYGIEAYNSGLHFTQSNTGILSNGTTLPCFWNIIRFLFDASLLMGLGYLLLYIINVIDIKFFEKNKGNNKQT